MALNEKSIHLLTEPGVYWDGDVPGFGLRIFPSGSKSFILQYRFKGREFKKTIGKWPALPLRAARDLARQRYTLLRAGFDPFEKESPETKKCTVEKLCDDFLEHWVIKRNKPKSINDTSVRIRSKIKPAFGKKQVDSIRRIDIQKYHSKVTSLNGPVEANRCLSLLHKMFECALDWGYLPENGINPASRIQKNPEKSRDVFLDDEGLRRLLEAVEREPNIYVRNGIWIYLLTGLRKMELLSRKWEDLNVDRKLLRFEDTKAGRPFYLPLSDQVLHKFLELKINTITLLGNPYIFPGSIPGSPLHDFPRPAWNRIRKKAGLENITIHSLRHTVASWLALDGVSLKKIGGMLNQSSQTITDRYAHLQAEELRGIADAHGRKIVELFGEKKAG